MLLRYLHIVNVRPRAVPIIRVCDVYHPQPDTLPELGHDAAAALQRLPGW
jgi:hypothetical protein